MWSTGHISVIAEFVEMSNVTDQSSEHVVTLYPVHIIIWMVFLHFGHDLLDLSDISETVFVSLPKLTIKDAKCTRITPDGTDSVNESHECAHFVT